MKKIIAIAIITSLSGCAHPRAIVVIKNLDGWQRVTEDFHPMVHIEVDAEGYPSAPKEVIDAFRARAVFRTRFHEEMQNIPGNPPEVLSDADRTAILAERGIGKTAELQRIRWQIHPDAPLQRVARLTSELTNTERSEIWTTHGIFIVGAPNYGGRRLPGIGKTDIEYRVRNNRISKNGKPWKVTASPKDSITRILCDLSLQSNLGFVNLYFYHSPEDTWSKAEADMYAVLPLLDGMRGLWLGNNEDGSVTLHFHDIWNNEWK